jgi:hypothetical protein
MSGHVFGVSIMPLSTNYYSNFVTDLTVWYFLFCFSLDLKIKNCIKRCIILKYSLQMGKWTIRKGILHLV